MLASYLQLRSEVVLATASAAAPLHYVPVSSDASTVMTNLRCVGRTPGQQVRSLCRPRYANEDVEEKVISFRIAWSSVHVPDAASQPLLDALSSHFLLGKPTDAASPNGSGSGRPSSASSPTTTRRTRPPVSPARVISKTTSRGSRSAAPVGSGAASGPKSVRTLRPAKLQSKLAQAHTAAVNAILENDAQAILVQPPYLVNVVESTVAWPHGGIAVFVQLPFLLDNSSHNLNKYVVHCRKSICNADDAEGQGGVYEFFLTLKGTEDESPASVEGNTAPSSLSTASTDMPVLPSVPTVVHGVGGAASSAAGTGHPPRRMERRRSTPASAEGSGSDYGADDVPPAAPALTPAGQAVAEIGAAATAAAAAGSSAAALGPASSAAAGATAAPAVTTSGGTRSAAGHGVSGAAAPTVPEEASASGAATSVADVGAVNGGNGGGVTQAMQLNNADVNGTMELSPVMAGLHLLFGRVLKMTNLELGLPDNTTVKMRTIKRSPSFPFALHCSFFSSVDLDVTSDSTMTLQTHHYICAAIPAKPLRRAQASNLMCTSQMMQPPHATQ